MALRAQANSKGRVRTGSIGGLSGVPGQLFGQVFGFTGLRGGLTNSLKGSVSAGAVIAGALSLKVALAGTVQGGATFASALTGAGGVMPSGASGIWYAKDYQSANKVVPNTVTVGATPVDPSILRMSTDGLNLMGGYYTATSVTVTDNFADGPTGATLSATRILGTGNCQFRTSFNSPSSGAYAICFDVKSNTGSSQSFRVAANGGPSVLGTYTATTSWQRIVTPVTFNSASAIYFAWSPDGTTGWDLLIDNIQIFPGSADLGREVRAGHMYFDNQGKLTTNTTNPATGVLDLSANGAAVVRFASSLTVTSGFTCGAMIKRTSASNGGYLSILSKLESYTGFTAFIEQNANTARGFLGGQQPSGVGVWDTNGAGWHLITHRYDGTYYDIFLDDARIVHAAVSPTATTVKNLLAGSLNTLTQFSTSHQFNSWFLYPTALTAAQIQAAVYPALKSQLTTDGQTHTRAKIICAEGDSITADASSYYIQSAPNLAGQGVTYAVAGSTLANMVARFTGGINALIPPGSTGSYIMSVLIGANDLATYTGASDAAGAANYTTALFSYYDSLRTNGFKVLAGTILPISGNAAHNARRAIVNSNILAAVGTHCDGVVDFASDAQMGADNAFTAFPANWTDGTHPNATGHARLAPIYYAAANAIT